ncbi:hypothetical protein RRG08_034211 [Elysia crispata]|uniref:Uncharacterized protein n=1 Tax=Elysia crispata TaxID=231223 RepID=A0AAE1DRF8_9GAST|nr:hypothetical protein RRG08_034211 [Elysia crispata]
MKQLSDKTPRHDLEDFKNMDRTDPNHCGSAWLDQLAATLRSASSETIWRLSVLSRTSALCACQLGIKSPLSRGHCCEFGVLAEIS